MPRSEPGPSRGAAPAPDGGPLDFVSQVLQVAAKDARVEWRSRELLYTVVLFAVLIVVVFSFAFLRQGRAAADVAGGLLWVVVAFSGTIGLGRFFGREREADTHRALLLAPASRAAIYLGKLLGVLLFTGATEAIVTPLVVLLFDLQIQSVGLLVALLALGTVGFAAVGSLFAASLMQSRSRDVLLGILLFPIVTPVIVAGAKGTAALLGDPSQVQGALVWLELLGAFDLIFITLSMWAFGPITRAE